MPCGPRCACLEEPGVECLSVLDPVNFAYFRSWCESGTEAQRRAVLGRSRIGVTTPEPTAPVAGQPTPAPTAEGQPCCGGQPPGLLTKAASLAKAVVTHVAAGMPMADDATVEARWVTCRVCEMFDAENVVCRACGCLLNVKIRLGTSSCPIGKW
jgi:hypothetical protein